MSRYRDDDRGRDDDRRSRGREDVRDDDRGRERSRGRDDGERDRGRGRDEGRGGSRFQYRERTSAAMERRSQMGNNDFDRIVRDGVKSWSVNDGANRIRILPATWKQRDADDVHFGIDVHVHYGIGPDRQSYLCPAKMKDERCPICEERALALKSGDQEYAKELEARRRVLVYMVDRDDEKTGLQVWAMPQSVDQDLAKLGRDRRTGAVLPIDHPEHGYDIEFDKEGAKKNTKYKGLMIDREASPLGNDRWLEEAERNPLPDILQFYDYDHIAKVFGAGPAPEDDDDRRGARDRGDRAADRGDDRRGGGDDRRGGGRSDDRRDAGGRSRVRDDDERGGGSDGSRRDLPTWSEVHEMSSTELDKMAERECPRLDPTRFKSDEELADAICEELGIRGDADDGGRRRLRDMRGDR